MPGAAAMSATPDPEVQSTPTLHNSNERVPLLSTHRAAFPTIRSHSHQDIIHCHVVKIHGEDTWVFTLRHKLRHFLSSKWGHYFVIALVTLDIAGIFASFLIDLHICEHSGEKGFERRPWVRSEEVIDAFSLMFSCLFMAELLGSVFAFGFAYFKSWFHQFDAFVIVLGFVIDVLLHGALKEAGSLVVVLRLWRVFKIVEEFSSGASDQMDALSEHLEMVEQKMVTLEKENEGLKFRLNAQGGGEDGHAS